MIARVHTLLALTLAFASLAAATDAHAHAPRVTANSTLSIPVTPGGFVNVKLPASEAAQLRADAPRGLARMRAASPVADRVSMALGARSMVPLLRTELMFPAAIEWGLDRWFKVEVDPSADVNAMVANARAVSGVEDAMPEILPLDLAVAPNDSLFSNNWAHGNTGTFPSYSGTTHSGPNVGTVGFDANVQGGWGAPAGFGSSSVIVAIMDTGVDPTHPDLRQVPGYDFWNNDTIPEDVYGHGTACAGVAAGIANNTRGVAGAAGGCSIMGLRITDDSGTLFSGTGLVNGLAFAIGHGAKITSMSFGASWFKLFSDALNAANSAGMVLFAATGNDNVSNLPFPASHPKVIAVGAASPCASRKRSASSGPVNPGVQHDSLGTSCDGEYWWGSSYGVAVKDDSAAVDILGPTMLPTTDIQGAGGFTTTGYDDYFNGTSCATPYVAGVAALLISQHPTWTPAQVRQRLMETAIDVADTQTPAGWDKYTGYGMVNAGLPDLTPYTWPGWAKSIVPRSAPDGAFGSVPTPSVLVGEGTTYVNAGVACFGEASSGAEDWQVVVDGAGSTSLGPFNLAPSTGAYILNAPMSVAGGRHVFGSFDDPDNSLPESNESNNQDAHQWVWQPAALALNQMASRAFPPQPTAGTSSIPVGETFYSNQDGLRASAPPGGTIGYWVVGLRSQNGDLADSDIRLYRPSTGATNGFVPTSAIAFSGVAGGLTDFAWWKLGSPNTPTSMDVGVARGNPFLQPLAGVQVENRASQSGITFNGTAGSLTSQPMANGQAIAVHYVDVQAGGAGLVTIELSTNLTGLLGAGLHVALISPADTANARVNSLQFSSTVSGGERLSRSLAAGLYGLVVYRDTGNEGMGAGTYTLTVRRTPAELVAGGAPGWYAPSVPFKNGVGSPTTAPTVLDGNVNNTIFAYSYSNTGPTAASGFQATETIDGAPILTWTPGTLPAGSGQAWQSTVRTVSGGLHTMGFRNDVTNVIDEFNETNNNHASQWVWSPLPMTLGVPVTRPALPDSQGGWSEIPANVTKYANVDGLRSPQFSELPNFQAMWGAVAVTPTGVTTNPDLRVYGLLSSGPANGFRSPDEISARPGDATDLVVVDVDNQPKTLDVGLYKRAGTDQVKAQAVSSVALLGLNASNTYGPYSIGPDSLIALFGFPFAMTYPNMTIQLLNLSGGANLDFMMFDRTDATRLYNPSQAVATAAVNGDGANEYYAGSIPAYAGLIVLKAGSADVAKKAMFQLVVSNSTVGVDDDLPTRIAFAPITPNPAHAGAAVRFDLPREMKVDLAAYDVGGRRVATLANGTWNAGRHAIHWTTIGDEGRPLASGMYFVRFNAGSYQATQRVLVVR